MIYRIVVLILILVFLPACENSAGSSGREKQNTSRIVNGLLVPDQTLPFLTRILMLGSDGNIAGACTGTFISPTLVLTAGHCLKVSQEDLIVQINPDVFSPVVGMAAHPEYLATTYTTSTELPGLSFEAADIAVLRTLIPYEGPLAIISSRAPLDGQAMVIAGYGRTSSEQEPDLALRIGSLNVDLVSYNDRLIYWLYDQTDESNTCFGDSGGPGFVQFSPDEPLVLVGVTSAGFPNCELNSLSWDTLVPHPTILSWIYEVTGGEILVF